LLPGVSVVSKDVPPFAVVVGTSGRMRRIRFPAPIIAALHRIAWCEWSHAARCDGLADFRQIDAAGFCGKDASASAPAACGRALPPPLAGYGCLKS